MNIVLIGIGGGIGAILRYLSTRLTHKIFAASFPIGILLVNILGSFLIGFLFSLFNKYKTEKIGNFF